MALFKHSYSGLITGGLGMPACCGLITMGFHVFKCKIEIVTPPPSGGGGAGGGPYVANGFYIPMTKQLTHTTKFVMVTVTYKDKTWKKAYVVDRIRAKIVVSAVNFINAARSRIEIGVSTIKRVQRRVTAAFKRELPPK